MDKSMIKGIVVGGVAVTALTAGGFGYQAMTKPVFAEVIATKEATETVKTPREECEDVAVQLTAARRALDRAFYDMLACSLLDQVAAASHIKDVRASVNEMARLLAKMG